MNPTRLAPSLFWLLLAATAACGVGIGLLTDTPSLAEGGPVEGASAFGLFAVAVAFAAVAHERLASLWAIAAILVLLAMRELDWDKAFLQEGVFQLRLYSGDAPAAHKVIGAAVVACVAAVLWRLARLAPSWFAALRQGRLWAISLAAGLVLVAVAKSLDGIGRKLAPLGIRVPEAMGARASAAEEILELMFVISIALAVTAWAANPEE